MYSIQNDAVKSVFDSFPPDIRKQLLVLRELILTTASMIPEVGKIEETLKWGEIAVNFSKQMNLFGFCNITRGFGPSSAFGYAA